LARELEEEKNTALMSEGFWNKRKANNKVSNMAKKLRKGFGMLKKEMEVYEFENGFDKENGFNPLLYLL